MFYNLRLNTVRGGVPCSVGGSGRVKRNARPDRSSNKGRESETKRFGNDIRSGSETVNSGDQCERRRRKQLQFMNVARCANRSMYGSGQ